MADFRPHHYANELKLGGKHASDRSLVYQWNGVFWEVVPDKSGEARAYRWLVENDQANASPRNASAAHQASILWLDELPMLINYFKGNMKLVGVRPLSRHYFELYNRDLQKRRIKYKPGLIPPFYADLPSDLDAIQKSESRYLDLYDKSPVMTDFRYFRKSVWNILFKHVRSG